MARKAAAKNIWYDDVCKTHYVSFEYGKDENSKRIKTTKTFKEFREAKMLWRILKQIKPRIIL